MRLKTVLFYGSLLCWSVIAASAGAAEVPYEFQEAITTLAACHQGKSGAYVLEKGEESLLTRAWFADNARQTIDAQYFYWSTDNIGILAMEALLRAAERGVKVRLLIDDLVVKTPPESLLALDSHPNIQIRIYNPQHSVGTSRAKQIFNGLTNFHLVNQRMHNKTFLVDGLVGIMGGRNLAEEYFDYNKKYNYRDRDILLAGPVVTEMEESFETYWQSKLAVPVERLLRNKWQGYSCCCFVCILPIPGEFDVNPPEIYAQLHKYAQNPENFSPAVHLALENTPGRIKQIVDELVWDDILFISDIPGKNKHSWSWDGGGATTKALTEALQKAQKTVTIQSPYLILTRKRRKIFQELLQRGVKVRISTNSLTSTDNLPAFSGYAKIRDNLLRAGIEVYEFKPKPAIEKELIDRYEALAKQPPTFSLHAKTMVIDGQTLFIGSFNLDPRSANLNTEALVQIDNQKLASQVEKNMLRDMRPENSWNAQEENPNHHAGIFKRFKMQLWKLLPINPLL